MRKVCLFNEDDHYLDRKEGSLLWKSWSGILIHFFFFGYCRAA